MQVAAVVEVMELGGYVILHRWEPSFQQILKGLGLDMETSSVDECLIVARKRMYTTMDFSELK